MDSTNGKAMKFEYNVGSPNGYCGVNRTLSQRNVAQYKGVSINLTGDNSGNTFTLQFKDKNDNYFEKEFAVDFYGEKTIKIPLKNLTLQAGNLPLLRLTQRVSYRSHSMQAAAVTPTQALI